MKKADKVIFSLLVVVAVLSTLVLLSQYLGLTGTTVKNSTDKKVDGELVQLGFYRFEAPRTLPDTPLENLQGEGVTLTNRHQQWQLVNFGYMFCPDICPVNLRLMAAVKTAWDADYPDNPLAITNITFDPARDTPEQLSPYLEHHHPDFYGLTGELDNIRALARQLNVVFIHEKPDEYGNYFVSHSDSIALINPDGLFAGLFKGPYEQERIKRVLEIITGV